MASNPSNIRAEFRILQPIWDTIRDGREDYLGSPLFPVFMSVTFYFVAVFPFMIIDLYGKEWLWVQKYKIQPSKEVSLLLIALLICRRADDVMIDYLVKK